jgi:Ca-activated chloride channel homolog
MKVLQGLFLSILVCLVSVPPANAQTRPQADDQLKRESATSHGKDVQEVDDNDVLRVTTSLVKVPVTVRDRAGRYITDLKQEDFKVYENGAEQRVAYFGGVEEPVSVVLLIDVSCSIVKPEDTIKAALTFIDQLRPADSVLPIAFGKNIYALLSKSTRDHTLLRERIVGLPDGKQTPCDNGTRLGDAVEFVINHVLRKSTGRRAVILLTDGRDSKLSKPGWGPRTLQAVSELGVPFYSVRLVGNNKPLFAGWPGDSEAEKAKLRFENVDIDGYIDELANLTGGRYFAMAQGEELKRNFQQIGEELRHQYMLAYYPDTAMEKQERRKIKVRVNKPKVSIRARDSYLYVPPGK